MVEHKLTDPVIGFSFDGTGYGDDETIWGGEVLIATADDYERVAHLAYTPLPGGDAAVKRPYRLALAYLWQAGIPWDEDLPPVQQANVQERQILQQQLGKSLNTVPTSSIGRLFDAVASLIGLRHKITYEAQAAMELEAIARLHDVTPYLFDTNPVNRPIQINPASVLRNIIHDMRSGIAPSVIAGRFHLAVARMIYDIACHLHGQTGLKRVVLSGGVFQNMMLLSAVLRLFEASNIHVYIPQKLPANDGGIAAGQALIAATRLDASQSFRSNS
jgi:hydrogenase maturation protein HypF